MIEAPTSDFPALSKVPTLRIGRRGVFSRSMLAELWAYRDLFVILVWRDLKVRYKQTIVGVAWVALQPLLAMAVFTLIFSRLAHLPSDGVAYPLFVFAAIIPWQFFSRALTDASTSLVANERVITKVYFPRILVPAAVVSAGLVDLAIASALLVSLQLIFGGLPPGRIALLPLFVAMATVIALGAGFWLSALDVRYRDVRYTLPFLTQLWMYASPVVYSSSLVPEKWRPLTGLNPMAAPIEGFRWCLLPGAIAPNRALVAVSCVVGALLLLSGILFFRKVERTATDHL